MSHTSSPIVMQSSCAPPNTFSILSKATQSVPHPSVQVTQTIPISATPFAAARSTGLVSPNAQMVHASTPVNVNQTVNSPVVSLPIVKPSPQYAEDGVQLANRLQQSSQYAENSVQLNNRSHPSQQYTENTVQVTNKLPPSPLVSQQIANNKKTQTVINADQNMSTIVTTPQLSVSQSCIQIPIKHTNPTQMSISQQARIPNLILQQENYQIQPVKQRITPFTGFVKRPLSPTAINGSLNLRNVQSSMCQTDLKDGPRDQNIVFPSIKLNNQISSLPQKPTVQLLNKQFEVRDYQGIISKASIENELLNAGYAPLSKIVVRTDNGDKRTQYIKAINKKGQKVFIIMDSNGYTTARSTDLTLIESNSSIVVPYSLKTGAYNCAGKDVCGVAFECGSDAVCVLSRGTDDLTPTESTFVFIEQRAPAAAIVETSGNNDSSIMSYPVIRLSEIRANPHLVLANTDIVTRRLRNNAYSSELQELASAQSSINRLNSEFIRFGTVRENVASKLNKTLTQLDEWNNVYITNPPTTDDGKDRYRRLQYNLTQRNDDIASLLRLMKKVADKRLEIDSITNEIKEITDFAEKEFANVEFAISE